MRRLLPLGLLALLASCGAPLPQADLLIPVNAKCTTCEDFIRCEGNSGNAAVYDPSFDLYQLKSKGTLAQLATVWEFLIQLFHTRTEDLRPLSIHAQRPDNQGTFSRSTSEEAEARIDLVQHRIYLPDGWIDQVTGEWRSADGAPRGFCRVLAPADGREMLKLFAETTPGSKP